MGKFCETTLQLWPLIYVQNCIFVKFRVGAEVVHFFLQLKYVIFNILVLIENVCWYIFFRAICKNLQN